jgi:hypothetical protein
VCVWTLRNAINEVIQRLHCHHGSKFIVAKSILDLTLCLVRSEVSIVGARSLTPPSSLFLIVSHEPASNDGDPKHTTAVSGPVIA